MVEWIMTDGETNGVRLLHIFLKTEIDAINGCSRRAGANANQNCCWPHVWLTHMQSNHHHILPPSASRIYSWPAWKPYKYQSVAHRTVWTTNESSPQCGPYNSMYCRCAIDKRTAAMCCARCRRSFCVCGVATEHWVKGKLKKIKCFCDVCDRRSGSADLLYAMTPTQIYCPYSQCRVHISSSKRTAAPNTTSTNSSITQAGCRPDLGGRLKRSQCMDRIRRLVGALASPASSESVFKRARISGWRASRMRNVWLSGNVCITGLVIDYVCGAANDGWHMHSEGRIGFCVV